MKKYYGIYLKKYKVKNIISLIWCREHFNYLIPLTFNLNFMRGKKYSSKQYMENFLSQFRLIQKLFSRPAIMIKKSFQNYFRINQKSMKFLQYPSVCQNQFSFRCWFNSWFSRFLLLRHFMFMFISFYRFHW